MGVIETNIQTPVAIIRNPREPGFLQKCCTWCCCICCGFLLFLLFLSLGTKKEMDQEERIMMGVELHTGKPYTQQPRGRPTVGYTVAGGTVPEGTVPEEITVKNEEVNCQTEACMEVVASTLSLINKTTPPCTDFYENACGNLPLLRLRPPRIPTENLHEKAKLAFEDVAKFLEERPDDLISSSETVLMKVYQKCMRRDHRDVEEVMKTLRDDFLWPFEEKKDMKNIEIVNNILAHLIEINPRALQLFDITGQFNKMTISPSFCQGPHEPINTELISLIFEIITENSKDDDVRKYLEKSLDHALDVEKARMYCKSSPTDQNKKFDADDVTESIIDFIQLFQQYTGEDMNIMGVQEIRNAVNFTDSYEFFQKESFLNKLLHYHSIGIAHYLVIKYLEDVSMNILLPEKKDCAKMVYTMMPETYMSTYFNYILHPENAKTIPYLVDKIRDGYLEMISTSSKIEDSTKETLIEKTKQYTGEIGVVVDTVHIDDDDTFYGVFVKMNFHKYVEALRHLQMDDFDSRNRKWSFNKRVSPGKLYHEMLTDHLFNTEHPLPIQFGRAGLDISTSMADHVIDETLHFKLLQKDDECMREISSDTGFLTEYFGMKNAWSGYKNAKESDDLKLDGVGDMTDDQLIFYSAVQSTCQTGSSEVQRHRVNSILKQFDGFVKTFECPPDSFMAKTERKCDPL